MQLLVTGCIFVGRHSLSRPRDAICSPILLLPLVGNRTALGVSAWKVTIQGTTPSAPHSSIEGPKLLVIHHGVQFQHVHVMGLDDADVQRVLCLPPCLHCAGVSKRPIVHIAMSAYLCCIVYICI